MMTFFACGAFSRKKERGWGLFAPNPTVPRKARGQKILAAAGNDENGNNDYPEAVVVKKIAQTVVHHRSPFKALRAFRSSIL